MLQWKNARYMGGTMKKCQRGRATIRKKNILSRLGLRPSDRSVSCHYLRRAHSWHSLSAHLCGAACSWLRQHSGVPRDDGVTALGKDRRSCDRCQTHLSSQKGVLRGSWELDTYDERFSLSIRVTETLASLQCVASAGCDPQRSNGATRDCPTLDFVTFTFYCQAQFGRAPELILQNFGQIRISGQHWQHCASANWSPLHILQLIETRLGHFRDSLRNRFAIGQTEDDESGPLRAIHLRSPTC
jgi:hypothetical protein